MNIRWIKQEAEEIVNRGKEQPRKILVRHTLISLGLSILLALMSELLARFVSGGGGLNGMGTRAVVDTALVVLQLAGTVAMPFWTAGLLYAMLRYVNGDQVRTGDLAEGFRRFGLVLSSGLMMGVQYVVRGFVSVYISSVLVMMTPFAAPAYELSLMLEENPSLDLMTANVEGLYGFYGATVVIFLLVFAVLALPIYYRYRMVNYIIMDEPRVGGMKALLQSRLMMYRRRLMLFRLDLSFWWFYLLELVLSILSLGSLIARFVGVELPIPAELADWGLQLIAAAGHLLLYSWIGPKMELTYALCYRQFLQPLERSVPQTPKNHPWTY